MAWKRSMLIFLSVILISGSLIYPAAAAGSHDFTTNTIFVNTFNDDYDLSPDGDCSLREAITSANTDSAFGGCASGNGADLILLSAGTYTLSRANVAGSEDANINGDLDLLTPPVPHMAPYTPAGSYYDVEISGAGMNETIIDMGQIDRAFDVFSGAWVLIENLQITNGLSVVSGGSGAPGGGIRNSGSLFLNQVQLYHNAAANGSTLDGGNGGAVHNTGTLDLDLCWLHFNDAGLGTANGQGGNGGGIYNSGITAITRSTVEYNWAGDITAGTAGAQAGSGGGIYNSGRLYVTDSTIYWNYAGGVNADGMQAGHGGGIYNSGDAAVLNTTLSYNSAGPTGDNSSTGGNGGGIYNSGSITVFSTSVIANRMFAFSNSSQGAGVFTAPAASLTLGRSLLYDNYNGSTSRDEDCAGTVTSDDYNLVYAVVPAICTIGGYTSHNLPPGTDPLVVFPIRDNGGPTQTYALAVNSPAVDYVPAGLCPNSDQRGFPRPVDGDHDGSALCDIGAYEKGMDYFFSMIKK